MLSNVSFNNQKGFKGLDQNVYITANFPNVNSKIEIEAAFNNLINRANQYIHKYLTVKKVKRYKNRPLLTKNDHF